MINNLTSNSASKDNTEIQEKEKAQGKLGDLTEDEGDYVTKQWQKQNNTELIELERLLEAHNKLKS